MYTFVPEKDVWLDFHGLVPPPSLGPANLKIQKEHDQILKKTTQIVNIGYKKRQSAGFNFMLICDELKLFFQHCFIFLKIVFHCYRTKSFCSFHI